MKKLILAVLCLCLVGCGTFDVKVQVVPTATIPARVTPVTPTAVPVRSTATATNTLFVSSPPTATEDPSIMLTNLQMSDDLQGWGTTSLGRIVKTANRG